MLLHDLLITGDSSTAVTRMISASTYITVRIRASSVLRRVQGACVSMYLFPNFATLMMTAVIPLMFCSSTSSRDSRKASTAAANKAVSSGVNTPGKGTSPSQCFATNVNNLCAKFPKSFANSLEFHKYKNKYNTVNIIHHYC